MVAMASSSESSTLSQAAPPPPPSYVEKPYIKNPRLDVNTNGWKDEPFTMIIFWIGMFQLSCLVAWMLFFGWCARDIVTANPAMTIAMIVICATILREPISHLVVKLVVHQLDTIWTILLLKGFSTRKESIVHDGLPFGSCINLIRTTSETDCHQGSDSSSSSLFIVYPCKEADSWLTSPQNRIPMEYKWNCWNMKPITDDAEIDSILQEKALDNGGRDTGHAILYLHGGGFVAANAAVLLQEAVTMTRQGITVYTLDYPLAPTKPYPNAIHAILKTLQWLKTKRGIQSVTLVGDSAGGSLACYTASLASSPKLLNRFNKETVSSCRKNALPTVTASSLPKVVGLVSIYGVLDSQSYYQNQLHTISWLEWKIAVHGLTFCLDCYMNPQLKHFPQHVSNLLTDPQTLPLFDFKKFPRTLFVCGNLDPLVYSTYSVHDMLKKQRDVANKVTLKVFSGRHAFVGLPRAWMGSELKSQAAQADISIGNFLSEINSSYNEKTRKQRIVCEARSRLFGDGSASVAATTTVISNENIQVVSPSRRH